MTATALGDAPDDLVCCAYRHLAVAAAELSRADSTREEEKSRYAAAAARFRDLAGRPWGLEAPWREFAPFVMTGTGAKITVADLFATACHDLNASARSRAIDPELVNEAMDLLKGLRWLMPSAEATAPPKR